MQHFTSLQPDDSIALFVKAILVYESDTEGKTVLPFFADGYPGIMYHQTENGLQVLPHDKQMPLLFLYGQTLKPIELVMEGSYSLIGFQLYPFVLNSFFNLKAQDLNDNCYDLLQLDQLNIAATLQQLGQAANAVARVHIITALLCDIFEAKRMLLDYKIQQAIQLIIDNNGSLEIQQLNKALHITERTFERRFLTQVGVSPKQFSQIIRFQQSLNQLMDKDYDKLTDIVYNNGFADQSHFIRVFKAFTGKTPKQFSASDS